MLQKRAKTKYHSAGLWSNTCCSHPRPGESALNAAHRRLKEEMGFDCPLDEIFGFVYKVKFENGLWEHEYDHVIIGRFNGEPTINSSEAENWRWVRINELKKEIKKNPDLYTHWLKLCLDRAVGYLK